MTNTETAPSVASRYFDALARGAFDEAASLMHPSITWHQPGANQFSGTHEGIDAVGQLLGNMMAATAGTFALELRGPVMANGDVVAVAVQFTGQRDDLAMDLTGVDLLQIADGKIVEVRLFTGDQAAEDAFWG